MSNENAYHYTVRIDWLYSEIGDMYEWVYQTFGVDNTYCISIATPDSLDWHFRQEEHAFLMTLRFHEALARNTVDA